MGESWEFVLCRVWVVGVEVLGVYWSCMYVYIYVGKMGNHGCKYCVGLAWVIIYNKPNGMDCMSLKHEVYKDNWYINETRVCLYECMCHKYRVR